MNAHDIKPLLLNQHYEGLVKTKVRFYFFELFGGGRMSVNCIYR